MPGKQYRLGGLVAGTIWKAVSVVRFLTLRNRRLSCSVALLLKKVVESRAVLDKVERVGAG